MIEGGEDTSEPHWFETWGLKRGVNRMKGNSRFGMKRETEVPTNDFGPGEWEGCCAERC